METTLSIKEFAEKYVGHEVVCQFNSSPVIVGYNNLGLIVTHPEGWIILEKCDIIFTKKYGTTFLYVPIEHITDIKDKL